METAELAEAIVLAAGHNESIRAFHHSKEWKHLWTTELILAHPPMRVVFEHAIVYGTIQDAISISRGKKTWGGLIDLQPLKPDDELHPCRITYSLRDTNRLRQKWEFRDNFKLWLGPNRSLVNEAVRLGKKDFLGSLKPEQVEVLRRVLDLAADRFWMLCRNGDSEGPGGIFRFRRRLEERQKRRVPVR
jgi:hypothetical protein